MTSKSGLVQYSVLTPNRKILDVARILGFVLLIVGLASILWGAYRSFTRIFDYDMPSDSYCEQLVFPSPRLQEECEKAVDYSFWTHLSFIGGMGLAALGAVMLVWSVSQLRKYFRRVRQGKIIQKDIFGGGNYPLEYQLLIEGYTYANELRRWWVEVSAGYWHDVARVGNLIDLRKQEG